MEKTSQQKRPPVSPTQMLPTSLRRPEVELNRHRDQTEGAEERPLPLHTRGNVASLPPSQFTVYNPCLGFVDVRTNSTLHPQPNPVDSVSAVDNPAFNGEQEVYTFSMVHENQNHQREFFIDADRRATEWLSFDEYSSRIRPLLIDVYSLDFEYRNTAYCEHVNLDQFLKDEVQRGWQNAISVAFYFELLSYHQFAHRSMVANDSAQIQRTHQMLQELGCAQQTLIQQLGPDWELMTEIDRVDPSQFPQPPHWKNTSSRGSVADRNFYKHPKGERDTNECATFYVDPLRFGKLTQQLSYSTYRQMVEPLLRQHYLSKSSFYEDHTSFRKALDDEVTTSWNEQVSPIFFSRNLASDQFEAVCQQNADSKHISQCHALVQSLRNQLYELNDQLRKMKM